MTTRRSLSIMFSAALLTVGVAGCGGGDDTATSTASTSSTAMSTPSASTASASTASASTASASNASTSAPSASTTASATASTAATAPGTVRIADFAFAPATLTVAAGTTVTWTNGDKFDHSIRSGDKSFDSEHLGKDQSFSHTFATPGTYAYVCGIHNSMTGSIVVTA